MGKTGNDDTGRDRNVDFPKCCCILQCVGSLPTSLWLFHSSTRQEHLFNCNRHFHCVGGSLVHLYILIDFKMSLYNVKDKPTPLIPPQAEGLYQHFRNLCHFSIDWSDLKSNSSQSFDACETHISLQLLLWKTALNFTQLQNHFSSSSLVIRSKCGWFKRRPVPVASSHFWKR